MSQDFRIIAGTDTFSDSRGYLNSLADALRTDFAGPTEPASPVAYQTWADTTTGYVRERNAANDAWIAVRRIGVDFGGALPLAGGTMEGPIAMGGHSITGLGLGATGSTAAARVQELDAKAPIAAPLFTGNARSTNDPTTAQSLVTMGWADAAYVRAAGGTMTGPLVLPGNAAADLQAVPRQQLRDYVGFNLTTGHNHDGVNSKKLLGLNSDGAHGTKFLRSDGTNGTSWSTARRMLLIAQNQLMDSTAAFAWTTINLSGLIAGQVSDLGIYAIYLRLTIPEQHRLEFRPDALSAADQIWEAPAIGAVDGTGTHVDVPLAVTTCVRVETFGASTFLHLRDVRPSATGAHVYIHALGYLEA